MTAAKKSHTESRSKGVSKAMPFCIIPWTLAFSLLALFVLKISQVFLSHTQLEPFDVDDWPSLIQRLAKESLSPSNVEYLLYSRSTNDPNYATFKKVIDSARTGENFDEKVMPGFLTAMRKLLALPDISDSNLWGTSSFDPLKTLQQSRPGAKVSDLRSKERIYYNTLLFNHKYQEFISTSDDRSRIGRLVLYGCIRRLDDGSLWIVVVLFLSSYLSCSAWCIVNSSCKIRFPRKVCWTSTMLFLVSVGLYLFFACVLPDDRGTFAWSDPGAPYEAQIKAIQFIEGLVILTVIFCAWLLFAAMWSMLLHSNSESLTKDAFAKTPLYIILACLVPFVIAPIGLGIWRAISQFVPNLQSYPSNFAFLGFVFYFLVNYLPFCAFIVPRAVAIARDTLAKEVLERMKLQYLLFAMLKMNECRSASDPSKSPPSAV